MTCGYAAVGRQEDGKKEGQEDGKQQGQEDGKGNHAATILPNPGRVPRVASIRALAACPFERQESCAQEKSQTRCHVWPALEH